MFRKTVPQILRCLWRPPPWKPNTTKYLCSTEVGIRSITYHCLIEICVGKTGTHGLVDEEDIRVRAPRVRIEFCRIGPSYGARAYVDITVSGQDGIFEGSIPNSMKSPIEDDAPGPMKLERKEN